MQDEYPRKDLDSLDQTHETDQGTRPSTVTECKITDTEWSVGYYRTQDLIVSRTNITQSPQKTLFHDALI